MKRSLIIVLVLLAVSSIFFTSCAVLEWFGGSQRDGWEGYMEALQKQNPGLHPYWIPNSDDGPGTILEIENGSEQLYLSAKYSFPDLKPDISSIPTSFVSEVSSIQFNLGVKGKDWQAIPSQLEAATNIAYTKNTEMTLSINHPKLYRISNALFTKELKKFDITNPLHEDILKKLMTPNVRLISGAISSNGFKFTFNNVLKLDAEAEATLTQKLISADLKFKKINETKFSVTADTLLFLAYYSYPVNIADLKSLYADLHRAREIKAEIKRIDSTKSFMIAQQYSLDMPQNDDVKYQEISKSGGNIHITQNRLSDEYFGYQKSLDSLYQLYIRPASMGGNNSLEIKKQMIELQKKLGLKTEDQKDLQNRINELNSKYESEQQTLIQLNSKEYTVLNDSEYIIIRNQQ